MALAGGGLMKKKVILRGPLLTRSGYGEQARFALRSLRSREDIFDIYIHPLQWGHTSWLNEENDERKWIDTKIEQTISYVQNGGTFDYSVQVTIPNEWESIAAKNIGYTAGIETTRIAHEWIQKGNEMDSIIVVSNHSKDVYENTKYDGVNQQTGEPAVLENLRPIAAVNYPVKQYDSLEPTNLNLTTEYNFLCVAQFGPRKNIENTIKWFLEEFKNDENVGLVVKTNVAKNCLVDRELCQTRLSALKKQVPDHKCKLYLLHGDMSDEEMHGLYMHPNISAALSLTHGEGFGLPLFEAAYMGVPVIATGWSGQLDFLRDEKGKDKFYNVSFDLTQVPDGVVWEGVLIKDSMWAVPREESAKINMRECLKDIQTGNTKYVEKHVADLKERFSEEKMYAAFIDGMGIDMEEFNVESWLDGLDIEEID